MKNILIGAILGSILTTAALKWSLQSPPKNITELEESIKRVEDQVTPQNCPELLPLFDEKKVEKAFLLFLASIGIKGNFSNEVQALIKDPEGFTPPPFITVKEVVNDKLKDKETFSTSFFYPQGHAQQMLNESELSEAFIEQLSEIDVNHRFVLKDPVLYLARSTQIEEIEFLQTLNGVYTGKLYRFSGEHKGSIEEIELSVDYFLSDNNKIDSNFKMIIYRQGEAYSTSSGGLRFMGNTQFKKALILTVSPHMFFHFTNKDLTTANVYVEGQYIGMAYLTRQ